jgi:hypothetical protein
MSSGELDNAKVLRPVRRGVCGKVPNISKDKWQLATFLPYYIVLLAGVLFVAGVIYGVVQAIANVYRSKQGDIEALGSW